MWDKLWRDFRKNPAYASGEVPKAGDTVICVNDTAEERLSVGKSYSVTCRDIGYVVIDKNMYFPNRFNLVARKE